MNINSKNLKAWTGLALIHREYKDIELAWANIRKVLDIDSDNKLAAQLIIDWGLLDNKIIEAIEVYESLIKQSDDMEYKYQLVLLYVQAQQYKNAQRELENLEALGYESNKLDIVRNKIQQTHKA